MNQELFKKFDGIITPAPELLHMDSWEADELAAAGDEEGARSLLGL